MIRPSAKSQLHPRNRFRAGYDFPRLIAGTPRLAPFVAPNAHGDLSIDFADPAAVTALNQALLQDAYGIVDWGVPAGYLCPPIPGRSDYLHHLADLLEPDDDVTVLDIGTGASCIYPVVGAREYGWRFVGSDIDPEALRWAKKLIAANEGLTALIDLRLQRSAAKCFDGVVKPGETFTASMCNPPFHASAEEAAEGTDRKRRNLGLDRTKRAVLNFGGHAGELWCDGGELGFIRQMITESAERPLLCRWFTTLVSKHEHLPRLFKWLAAVDARDVMTLEMAHGQKKSRILAWSFAPRARQ